MTTKDIAIIGIAGRFPHAKDMEQFYLQLRNGKDCVGPLSEQRIRSTTLEDDVEYDEGGYIEGIELFDHEFFKISQGEANHMDPRQRLLLEVVYETMENAGYNTDHFNNSDTALYVADNNLNYYLHAEEVDATLMMGNLSAATAGRIARFFNLRGSAEMVDTACSSSLAVLNHACNELILGNADYALACGANVYVFPGIKVAARSGLEIRSPDSRARAFAAGANGTVEGEAVVCVLLKPLEKALADKDVIHAVIKAVASNQDGALSSSLTAPDSKAQAQVITKAWKKANIDPATVTYIEAHGTGTKLGDPIEIDGLNMAFREFTDKQHFCAVSSVKTNIGHTDVVAGLAGVAKAVLSLHKKELFPSLHFDAPNPYIDFNKSAVYVNTTLQPWPEGNSPRRAGVSSYGLIGTNYHAVLEEAPELPATAVVTEGVPYLFNLSAASLTSLCDTAKELYSYLCDHNPLLQDISYTLNAGRKQHRYRCSFIADNKAQLLQALDDIAAGRSLPITATAVNMICCFSASANVPASMLDACSEQYPEFARARYACGQAVAGGTTDAAYRQFVFQYAFYQLLTARGVTSLQLLGDGVGKLVIAVLKQEITLQEGIRRVLNREWTPVLPEALFERLRKYVEKEQPGSTLFAGMEPTGDITAALQEIFKAQGSGMVISPAEQEPDCLLPFIQQLYLAGIAVDWNHFYGDVQVKRVVLPAYRFQLKRCWIKEIPVMQVEKSFYGMQWTPQPLPAAEREKAAGPLLVVMDEKGLGEILVKRLQAAGHTCIGIRYRTAFRETDHTNFEINPASRDDFAALRTAVRERFPAIGGIIYLANYGTHVTVTAANADALLEKGLYALLLLMQAFWYELDDKQVDLLTVSANAHAVLPGEKVRMPLGVMPEIFAKGVSLEFPRLHVKGIDLDAEDVDLEAAAAYILQEWEADTLPRFAAIRQGSRWVPNLLALAAEDLAAARPVHIKPGGVYLVTGGAGGIGLEVCKSLAARNKVQLIIFGRKQLPAPEEWAAYSGEQAATVKELLVLLASGSTVWYHALDVADPQQVTAAFTAITARHQQLDGIFHAAGVFEKGYPLPDWTLEQFGRALAPKVKGSLLLAEHSRALQPGFIVFFSSVNAIAIPACNTDYAAANAFQDAFAAGSFPEGTQAVSINWPGWADTGMLFRSGHVDKAGYLKNISTQEGIDILYKAMSAGRQQVAVLPFNKKAGAVILEDNPFFLAGAEQEKPESAPAPVAPAVPPVAEADTASTVRRIWYEVLQSENISDNDDFFDLGGHSLNGMQVINKLNKIYGTALDFEILLDYATVSTLAAYIDDWLAQHNNTVVENKDIMPAPVQDAYDLSYAQKKLWLFDQVEKDKQPYIMPEAYFIGMALNEDAMCKAVETVVERHESLRTVFIVKDGEPKQKVRSFEESGFTCMYMDLNGYADAEERIKLQTAAHAQLPFDLAKGPLIRVTLIKRSEDAYVILIAVHHIIADAWSMDVIVDEVLQCYYAYEQGMSNPLAPLRIQYKDYVVWQQQQRSSGKWDAHRSFWLQTLQGTLPVLQLPLDMERGSLQTFRGADVTLQVDAAVLSGLKQLCQEQDTTLFVVLLAAYTALLHRYSGQYDLLLASPVAGRKHEDLTSQVGFYINTLLVRTKLTDNMSFAALVQQTRQYMIQALLHDDYPFDLLVKDLQVERVTNRSLLIDSGFSWLTAHTGAAVQPLYNIQRLEDEVVAAKYDLWLYGTEVADGILFKLEYNCDLFKASSMQLFAERWASLIMQIVKQPDILLNDIIMDSMLLHDEAETMPYAGDSFDFEYPLGNS
ncbi:Ketoacyl-synthetase C-terminal extension [Chitinophaga rupis]|uniref:Ketoacyl-synthetase C-terminal extension n=1 Tax=Chitinophaga rupis TaxID=573321 RepID=A0A1H8KRG9_9BACT|nr:SDR family NAD(P)-dependent oxidoreductase [Chitinophaga rupis]SEN95500.1 Ketoacyl-synthetase C-terminal extension [Chitinophaga rupis]